MRDALINRRETRSSKLRKAFKETVRNGSYCVANNGGIHVPSWAVEEAHRTRLWFLQLGNAARCSFDHISRMNVSHPCQMQTQVVQNLYEASYQTWNIEPISSTQRCSRVNKPSPDRTHRWAKMLKDAPKERHCSGDSGVLSLLHRLVVVLICPILNLENRSHSLHGPTTYSNIANAFQPSAYLIIFVEYKLKSSPTFTLCPFSQPDASTVSQPNLGKCHLITLLWDTKRSAAAGSDFAFLTTCNSPCWDFTGRLCSLIRQKTPNRNCQTTARPLILVCYTVSEGRLPFACVCGLGLTVPNISIAVEVESNGFPCSL